MAVHVIESPIHVPRFAAEPRIDPFRAASGTSADGSPEIDLGAFRGLAFALLFETVLVIFGALAWQIFRAFH